MSSRDAEAAVGAGAKARLTFDLSSLGWKAFQDLCGTVLRTVLGQTVTGFAGSRDLGRDFAFHGTWHRSAGESAGGRFVVQCKFQEGSGSFAPSDVTDEMPKIRKLHDAGVCDTYVLMTNAGISSATAITIGTGVREQGPEHFIAIDGPQLDAYLRENPRLRALVPRVYGLGDLSEILDERAYAQTSALLEALGPDLRKFVITAPYLKASDALNAHGFVLLLGSPGVGKSMIAQSLAVSAVDQWRSLPLKVDAPEVLRLHWNPVRSDQLMWIDDAFGTTQFRYGRFIERHEGSIIRLTRSGAVVSFDRNATSVYWRWRDPDDTPDFVRLGVPVTFDLAFNMRGGVAVDVRPI